MRFFVIALALVLCACAAPASAQSARPDGGVATLDDARSVWFQPASTATRHSAEWLAEWTGLDGRRESFALYAHAGGLGGFLVNGTQRSRAWGVSLSGGDDDLRLGWTAYRTRVAGVTDSDHRLGALSRPLPWLSLAGVVDHAFEPRRAGARVPREWTLGVGLRPLALDRATAHTRGTRLTLTADVVMLEGDESGRARVRVGAELEPVDGIALAVSTPGRDEWRMAFTLRGLHGAMRSGSTMSGDATVSESWSASAHSGEERTALAGKRDRRVAVVRAGGVLADEDEGGASLMGGGGSSQSRSLHRQLERALEDPLTRGVLLELRGVAGMAQLEELRPRLDRLRAAGKPVVASMETGGGRGDLYLASACDRVFASEEAVFMALGLRSERRYYRELLGRWGIRMDRASVGQYKSAYRQYSADSTPSADSVVIQRTLDQRQELFVRALAESRHVGRERFEHILDGRAWTSADLRDAGLIDEVGYRDDAWQAAGGLTGLGRRPRTVNLRRVEPSRRAWTERSPIAVVYASGGIEEGRSGSSLLNGATLGHETLVAQLERAFRARHVRVVVLRIESPGGSVVASNLIDHAIVRLKKETGKPLVVSMGSVAASGGYYIALRADRILADRHTATGSIGVLFVKPSFEGLYERLGVRQEDFDRGSYMGATSPARNWSPAAQAAADSAIGRSYSGFKARVAAGRKLDPEQVEAIAQGRVWYGADALERRLVDGIGGLELAIAEARQMAGVPRGERIRLREFRRPRGSFVERLFGGFVRAAIERETRAAAVTGARAEAELDALDE
ncbi:MAG: signal peptide peptidase SppA [Candidatus Eisenbacteria bacterium]|nr:signal peptide peptidase SppA [Candidatus Eisenbacteria bacterium]